MSNVIINQEQFFYKCQQFLCDLPLCQKKHKTRVAFLREELEKEEMYVEYLNKLLIDIERHRKQETHVAATCDDITAISSSGPHDEEMTSQTVSAVATMNDENKRRSQNIAENADLCDLQQQLETKRASLHLDIEAVNKTANGNGYENCSLSNNSPFVTVISVSSPTAAAAAALKNRSEELNKNQFQNLTFTKKKALPGNKILHPKF